MVRAEFPGAARSGQTVMLLMMAPALAICFSGAVRELDHSIPVMMSIFVATVGALLGLAYAGMSLSIYAQLDWCCWWRWPVKTRF